MQDIIFPKHKKAILESLHERQAPQRQPQRGSNGNAKKYILWTIGVLITLAVIWYGAAAFSTADVFITPNREAVTFNDMLVASRASTTPDGSIAFQIMTLKDETSGSVPATKSESLTDSAKGVVVLYNLTTTKQKLIARTRLEATSGKLYRTSNDVTIPAAKTVSGKLTPGSIEANIQAALPGEAYNTDLTDFTIPGFKGSAKFSKFYGRSKTKISGGFVGTRAIATSDALASARTELKSSLADKLSKKAVDSIPDGWIMYKDGTFLDLAENQSTDASKKDSVTLTETGTLQAIILKQEDLLDYVVNHKLKDTTNTTTYKPAGLEALAFSITNRSAFAISSTETFTMSLKGNVTLTADIPTEQIKADLAGLSTRQTGPVFRKYPGIALVSEIRINPGFISSLPSSKDKITIHVNQAK